MRSVLFAFSVAAAALAASGANATITASLDGNRTNLLTLDASGLSNGGTKVANLVGGSIYTSDETFADIPKGGVFGGKFLATGLVAGQPATMTFIQPTSYLSFLWGSPDTFNQLSVTTNLGNYLYTPASLGFMMTDGNQSFSQYVQFATGAGELISSVLFTNVPGNNAFEVANFSVSPVPEPAAWAMMVLGFGIVGAAARSRRRSVDIAFA